MSLLTIQSYDYLRFSNPRYFSAIKQAADASGMPVSSIRSTRETQAPVTRRATGYPYKISWIPPRPTKDNCVHCSSRTKPPRQNPPGHIPPNKNPLDKTPQDKNPRTKPPQSKIFVFHFVKIFMISQVRNLLIVQWLPV